MYFLFTYSRYYPQGGMNDFQGEFTSIAEALARANRTGDDYYQIVTPNMTIVSEGSVGSAEND